MRMKISRRRVELGQLVGTSQERARGDRAGKTGRSGTLHMSRGRRYPDVGAIRAKMRGELGVRETREEKRREDRHTTRESKGEESPDKPEVRAGVVRERGRTVLFSPVTILFFFFPLLRLSIDHSDKREARRTGRNDKLCRFRVGSDNFWDSRTASTRRRPDNAPGYKTEM